MADKLTQDLTEATVVDTANDRIPIYSAASPAELRYMTPANILSAATVSDASTTVKGKVELATDAETLTGTDQIRSITPSNLKYMETQAQTLTNKTLTSPVINTGVSGTAIDTDGTLSANSDTKLATQKAVRTYVAANGVSNWTSYSAVVPTRTSSVAGASVLTFAGVDLTGSLGVGKKVKLTQTAGSNTQSLDLESGSSQYALKTDTASLSITGTITIEAWIKIESLSGVGQTIVGKWYQDGSLKSYLFYVNSDNSTLRFDYSGDSSAETNSTSAACISGGDIGRWVHVAVVVTPSTKAYTFYKNGVVVSSGTGTGTQVAIADNTSTFAIGARDVQGTPDTFFDGKICEVKLWNIARTQAQIQGDMFHNLAGNESGLAGYWKLDNAYTDGTANGNTLTASGSPVFSADVPGSLTTATKYGIIGTSSFSTNTTITVATGEDYGIDDGTISNFNYSFFNSPVGFPDWISFCPYVLWNSTQPSSPTITRAKFKVSGRQLYFLLKQNNVTAGTTNTQCSIDGLPIAPAYSGATYNYPCTGVVSTSQDSGASSGSSAVAGFVYSSSPTVYIFFGSQSARSFYISGFYDI